MKNSGIEWIGEIPENWEVVKLKNISIKIKSGGTPESSNDKYYNGNIPWTVIADMSNADTVLCTKKCITEEAIKSKNLEIFKKGALLYAIYASVGKVSELGIDSTINQAILAICLNNNLAYKQYAKLILKCYEIYVIAESNGNTQFNLNAEKVANFSLPYPPIDEQQKIADYLDKRCENIDGLVELQNRMIEKLKEYKQSVITEAVTKGLDPAAKMKNSGVEWIGEIPENWEVKRLKNICKIRTGSTLSKSSNENYYSDEGLLWVKPDNLSAFSSIEKTAEYINEKGQQQIIEFPPYTVFVCCIGTIGKIGYSKYPAYCNQQINGLIFYESILKRFGLYMIFAQEEQHWIFSNGNVIKIINAVNQGKINVPIPPIDEQQKIADYLDAKCAEIDRLIEIKQKKIEKLQDYKKSLIYECVTGKREIS